MLVTFATNTLTLLPQMAGNTDWSDVRRQNWLAVRHTDEACALTKTEFATQTHAFWRDIFVLFLNLILSCSCVSSIRS